MTDEPTRVPQDPAVRTALAALAEWDEAAPAYDLQAETVRFRATLGLPPSPPPAATPNGQAAIAGSGGALAIGVAAACLAVAAGSWLWLARTPVQHAAPLRDDRSAQVAMVPSAALPPVREEPRAPEPVTPPPEVMPAATPAPAPVAPPIRKRPRPQPNQGEVVRDSPAAEPASELELLRSMRAALAGSPARALRIASDLDRAYPHGVLMEERQALRVLALDGAGKKAQAATAAAAFLLAHPGSAFASRIEVIARTPERSDIGGEGFTSGAQESQ